jgi:hypothetical protein
MLQVGEQTTKAEVRNNQEKLKPKLRTTTRVPYTLKKVEEKAERERGIGTCAGAEKPAKFDGTIS